MVQETGQPEPNTRAGLVDWAQSLVARASRARSVLSPWVQRALETGASGRIRPLSLFEGDGRALVERVTRQGESSRVWRPDLGRVSPSALDRFGGEIVHRHQPLADKYRVEIPDWDEAQSTGLVLAPGGALGPAVMPGARQPGPPSGLSPMPAAQPSPPPALQQQAVPPPVASREQRVARHPPGSRVFSRIEEVTPTVTRAAEPESPQQPGTDGGARDEDGAAEGKASPAQAPAAPLQRALESPPVTAAGEQEALAQGPSSPPGKAPSSEAKATPEIDLEREEQSTPAAISEAADVAPPPVAPPPVEIEGKAQPDSWPQPDRPLELERQAEEDRPSPVPPPEVGASEAEQASNLGMPPVGRREDEELPATSPMPKVEAAAAEPGPGPEAPPLDRGGGEEQPARPSAPAVQAAAAEPPGVEPGPRPEVLPLQRALLKDQSPLRGERTEVDVPGPMRTPEIEAPGAVLAPGQEMPPEQRLEGKDAPAVPPGKGEPPVQGKPGPVRETPVRKVPGQRPPPTGPRWPAQRLEEGQEPLGVPDERPVPDPALPVSRRGLQPRAVEHRPVQRTAILPQARMGVHLAQEPARSVGPQGPLREGFWTEAEARRTQGTRALPLRVPIQAVMEGTDAVPEAPVQRLPLAVAPRPETESAGAVVVQRQNGNGPAVSAAPTTEEGEPDLDQLARQVYPLVKRMLAVERERRFSR